MSSLVAAYDWSRTALGPMEQWPQSLKTMVRFMLDSRYSMWMGWGPDLTFFYNDAYARDTLGAKHPWALGRRTDEVWAEIWKDVSPRIEQVLQRGEATWDEGLMLFLERSGYSEETYHTFSYSPIYGDDNAIAGMFCVVTEETQRVISERRVGILRDVAASLTTAKTESEVHSAAVRGVDARTLPFTLTFIGDQAVSRSGLTEGTDPAMSRAASWPLAEVVASRAPVLVDDLAKRFTSVPCGAWTRPSTQALLLPIMQPGQEPSGVFVAGINPHRHLDESYRGFLDLLVGQIAAALTTVRSFQEERERAEALAALDHAKTTFFSNVSHELRTPLTLMLGPLEDALRDDGARGPQRERLDIAHRNALRLLKLVNSLLDFSRIEAGRVQASFQPTDLAKLTNDLASVFRSAIERAGMTFTVDVSTIGEPVYVDRDMWEKVVLNLLSNAFKYTLAGGIDLTLRRAGGEAELRVRDTGLGIPAEELPQLFQRFHRVEGARGRTQEGTGIGLALVNELVRLHGGRIHVDSVHGKGSTFAVLLPLGTAHLPAARIKAESNLPSTAVTASAYVEEALRWLPDQDAPPGVGEEAAVSELLGPQARTRGARVIVADDNADMRAYLSRLLQPFWSVEAVQDGEAAFAAAVAQRPDLVLTDVMMPGLDGFGLLEKLRANPALRDVPVIMLSARAGEESRVEGMHAGADDYLVKPFSSRELIARVGAHLELARVRNEHEAAIADARRRTDAALLAADVGTYYWPLGSDRVFGDSNYARIMGVELDSAGSVALDVVRRRLHEDHRAKSLESERTSSTPDPQLEIEYRLVLDDGTERWIIARARIEHDRDGVPVGRGGVVVDVTERKRAEERLLEAEREARLDAERVGRMKDEFLATLSHELRTPLNAMLGWTQLLRRRRSPENIDEGLDVIERNARTQAQLIEDLLDMSRIVAGKIRLDVQRVDLSEVIAAALDVVRPAAEAKGVRLVQTLDPQAGPVSGDPGRLQQILWNLLSNAVKFTPRHGRVHVVLERVASHVELSVADTGQGIGAAFLPHVFERFRQEDGTAGRAHGGLGLGLAIVKQLVELHGGQVNVTSAGESQGATFVVSLPIAPLKPVADSADVQRAASPAVHSVVDGGPSLARLKVLVVDDDRDARDILRYMLEECGADVITAENAGEALIALRVERPDLLLSDIGMPGVDGYELMRRIRQLGPEEGGRVPAVAISAFARSEDRRRALMAGYQMHLSKPVEPAELRAVCASLADRN